MITLSYLPSELARKTNLISVFRIETEHQARSGMVFLSMDSPGGGRERETETESTVSYAEMVESEFYRLDWCHACLSLLFPQTNPPYLDGF